MPHSRDAALSALMGTWTFSKEMEASRYYSVKAFVVIHFMPDPLQYSLGCHKPHCDEVDNKLCQREPNEQEGTCVDTETDVVEWSEVSAFLQFGWEVGTGYYWRNTVTQNTTDWLGPYNFVLGTKEHKYDNNVTNATTSFSSFVSRYVQTPATEYLHYPPNCQVTSQTLFDRYAGATAVKSSIAEQRIRNEIDDNDEDDDDDDSSSYDPYQNYTCPTNKKHKNKDDDSIDTHSWSPLLPRVELFPPAASDKDTTLHLKLDYDIFAFPPSKKDPLYKEWPALATHFEKNQVKGPYCWNVESSTTTSSSSSSTIGVGSATDNDVLHGYSIPLSYDTRRTDNNDWVLFQSCHHDDNFPCWHDKHGNDTIPVSPSSGNGGYNTTLLLTYGCYFFGLVMIVSLVWNCQLSKQLKRAQQQQAGGQQQERQRQPPAGYHDENGADDDEEGAMPALVVQDHNEVNDAAAAAASLREPLLAAGAEGQGTLEGVP